MRTFQNRLQLSLATLEVGTQVMILGENAAGSDGFAIMTVFDSSLSSQLPDDRVTLSNGNIAAIPSEKLRKYVELSYLVSVNTSTEIDLKQGKWFDLVLDQNIDTLTFANTNAINNVTETINLKITQDSTGGYVVTWPVSIIWSTGSAPVVDITPDSVSFYRLTTFDQGVTWFGFVLTGDYVATADIGVTVLPKVEWVADWTTTNGLNANGEFFPDLVGKEVFIVIDDTGGDDEVGSSQFVIPEITGYTDVKFKHSILDANVFEFDYLDGAVLFANGRIRAIFSREPQDLPALPTFPAT